MKVLYVLVSDDHDFYYEQAVASIISLKHVKPEASISLLVDDKTDKNLVGTRVSIKQFIDEYNVVELDSQMSPMIRSRYLKTSMREYVGGDFLYVDVDTVWAEPYDESDFIKDIMAVPDGHVELKEHSCKDFIYDQIEKASFSPPVKWYVNSGVLFVRDTQYTRHFFAKWHENWKKSCLNAVCIDQPALNQVNSDLGNVISLLPDCYNSQIGRCIKTLASAKIIHYFSSWESIASFKPSYKFLKKDFLLKVRSNPYDEDCLNSIYHPKEAFDDITFIVNKEMTQFWESKLCADLLRLEQSENSADVRLFKILRWCTINIPKWYYRIIPYLYPLYRVFKR